MRKLLVAAALCAASGAWAGEGVLTGSSFSVSYTTFHRPCPACGQPQVDGSTILWPIDLTLHSGHRFDDRRVNIFGRFDLTPAFGFDITGYDVQVDLRFNAFTYTYTGNEVNGPFFPAGTTKSTEGYFSFGSASEHFDYQRAHESLTAIQHFDTPNLLLSMKMELAPYFRPCPYSDPFRCTFGWPDSPLGAAMTIDQIRIVPTIVAVPEPATYALMAAGLLAIGLARRHGWPLKRSA